MYYSSTLFALVGFSNPVAVGLVVAGTNFIMVRSYRLDGLPIFGPLLTTRRLGST